MQLFDEEFANSFAFDVLDSTKIIPDEDVPVKRVGKLVLDFSMPRSNALADPILLTFPSTPLSAPFIIFSRMDIMNPKGRANYEPNSWPGAEGDPRECHQTGFQFFPAHEEGDKPLPCPAVLGSRGGCETVIGF